MGEGVKDQKTERMSSKSLEKSQHIERSAMDGGWGWMIVAGCFLTTVCTRGVTRCVSIFFVEFQTYFSRDYSATAWIHSLLDCTTMLCAPLGSYIGNRLSSRIAIIIGGMLSSAGLLLSSFATSLEFLYLTLGVVTGLGFALSYTPAIAMVGSYFTERKTLAYGISMSGSGIGTFILAPVVQLLIERFSWRGALLILGGLVSHLCVCGALMRPLGGQSRREKIVQRTDAKRNALDIIQLEGKTEKDTDVESAKDLQKGGKERLVIDDTEQHSSGELKQISEHAKMNELNIDSHLTVRDFVQSDDPHSCCLLINQENVTIPVVNFKQTALVDSKGANRKMLDEPTNSLCSKLRDTILRETSFLLIPDFLLLLVSFLFLAYGCSVPFVYLVPYSLGAGVSPQQAPLLMSILGVSGIVGTITFGWIADRKCLRSYRMVSYMLAVGSEGLSCLFLPFLRSFALLVPFSLFYGYFDGAYVALIPVVTSDTVSPTQLTSALGVVYFLHAIPYLISPPIGGWLVDKTGSYTITFLLSGISLICSAMILGAVRLILHCTRGRSCLN